MKNLIKLWSDEDAMWRISYYLLALAFITAALALFTGQNKAQERIGLTAPAFVQAGVTNIKVVFLQCDWDNANVIIGVRATNTNAVPLAAWQRVDFTYTGTTASNLMKTLNTNRFDTVSLHRKIILRLTADGHISGGSFSGQPE